MPDGPKKTASNIEINKGSILLLFSDKEAEIVRRWRKPSKALAKDRPGEIERESGQAIT